MLIFIIIQQICKAIAGKVDIIKKILLALNIKWIKSVYKICVQYKKV